MGFIVRNLVEHRDDDPNLLGYSVILEDKSYMVYYNQNELREVYLFPTNSGYFMSCRIDMKTISHYYIVKDNKNQYYLKRYEEGKMNRIYYFDGQGTFWFYKDGKKVTYKSIQEKVPNDKKAQIYTDLINFLNKFNELKLYELFSPEEPQE